MRLTNQVALVTGSSRGIGRAIALRLAEEGADVAVTYRADAKDAQQVLATIEALGRRAIVLQGDVGRVSDCNALIDATWQRLGRLDILVNNAGVETAAPFWEVTEADYDRVLDTILKGTFFTAQAFTKRLIAAKRPGRIINISSVHEEIPFPGYAAYCAAKGGIKTLTRDLAVELGRFDITVNAIAPGAIETDINKTTVADPARRDALLHQIPARRLGRPEDVAGVAAFLASADAAYVTGSTYFVDGGLTWFYEE